MSNFLHVAYAENDRIAAGGSNVGFCQLSISKVYHFLTNDHELDGENTMRFDWKKLCQFRIRHVMFA